jgi:integrase
MQNLLRRGATYYARLFIPSDRWADVGKAVGARGGTKREVVRTLQTTDIREARGRLRTALTAMQADVDARLIAARLRPLTDWTASWPDRAVHLREVLQSAGTEPIHGTWVTDRDGEDFFVGDSEREMLIDSIVRDEAQRVGQEQGLEAGGAFFKAVTTEKITLRAAADTWLAEVGRSRKRKTAEGHRRVFTALEEFLRERYELLSFASTTFDDVTRRMAGDFIHWRAGKVSPPAVRREFSAPMGLWRWAIRRGHTDMNPWTDQTAGLDVARSLADDRTKRAFTVPELVTLIRASGSDWSPNGGGYGATLWDAVRLALLTGLRAAELADLRIRDLIEDRTAIAVPGGKTRNARRTVPLPQVARDVIAARLSVLPDRSPEAPLWPELPVLGLTGSRGGKLSDRFRMARERLLPDAAGVDLHSLRRSYATMLEAAMNAGGRVNPTLITTLLGQARGTLALDRYSAGATLRALKLAVTDLQELGIPSDVDAALGETQNQRPTMVRFKPNPSGASRTARPRPPPSDRRVVA